MSIDRVRVRDFTNVWHFWRKKRRENNKTNHRINSQVVDWQTIHHITTSSEIGDSIRNDRWSESMTNEWKRNQIVACGSHSIILNNRYLDASWLRLISNCWFFLLLLYATQLIESELLNCFISLNKTNPKWFERLSSPFIHSFNGNKRHSRISNQIDSCVYIPHLVS